MGMREDIETMQRHQDNGTLREYFTGEADPIPLERDPLPIGFYPLVGMMPSQKDGE